MKASGLYLSFPVYPGSTPGGHLNIMIDTKKIEITLHSIMAFKDRANLREGKCPKKTMFAMLSNSTTIVPKASYRTKSIIKHGFEEIAYYNCKNIVFVIRGKRLVTVLLINKKNHKWKKNGKKTTTRKKMQNKRMC